MRVFLLVFVLTLFVVGCAQKTQEKHQPSRPKSVQIREAEKAFEELEREVGKEFKGEKPQSIKKPTKQEEKKRYYTAKLRERVKTKYPLKDGYPVWFWNPFYGGVIGAIGIAKPVKGKGLAYQRRMAKIVALSKLAKQFEVFVYTETTKVEEKISRENLEQYRKKFKTFSRQEVKGFILKNARVEDEWINPKTGELYIWVIIPKD